MAVEFSAPRSVSREMRVSLSGRLDTLTTRKIYNGYALIGRFRLDVPYRGVTCLSLQLPMGSSLLAGDSAVLEGVLRLQEPETWLFDCCP